VALGKLAWRTVKKGAVVAALDIQENVKEIFPIATF
jgi:hypothetical protein